jgi:hypothetical protein
MHRSASCYHILYRLRLLVRLLRPCCPLLCVTARYTPTAPPTHPSCSRNSADGTNHEYQLPLLLLLPWGCLPLLPSYPAVPAGSCCAAR